MRSVFIAFLILTANLAQAEEIYSGVDQVSHEPCRVEILSADKDQVMIRVSMDQKTVTIPMNPYTGIPFIGWPGNFSTSSMDRGMNYSPKLPYDVDTQYFLQASSDADIRKTEGITFYSVYQRIYTNGRIPRLDAWRYSTKCENLKLLKKARSPGVVEEAATPTVVEEAKAPR